MGRIERINIAGGRWETWKSNVLLLVKLNVRHFESSKR